MVRAPSRKQKQRAARVVIGEQQVDVIRSIKLRLAAFAMEPIGTLPAGVSDGGVNAAGASSTLSLSLSLIQKQN